MRPERLLVGRLTGRLTGRLVRTTYEDCLPTASLHVSLSSYVTYKTHPYAQADGSPVDPSFWTLELL